MSELVVKGLTYKFPDTKRGAENISFSAPKGQLTVLSAPSGKGKSTTLAVIAGVLNPQAGSISYAGKKIQNTQCALVLQTAQVFEQLNAWENVACAWGIPSSKTRRQALAQLRNYGLKNVSHSLPEQMSGGERTRLALVTALAQGKEILLVDEPTSSLDDINAQLVINALKQAAQDRVVVVATHDERLSSHADQIVKIA